MMFLSGLKKLPGKVCLLRVDFNVENVEDSFRLESSLPTMKLLLKMGAKIVILSHRGRPVEESYKERSKNQQLSLKELQPFLEKNLKTKVAFSDQIPSALPLEVVVLIENLRFWPEEESNDLEFAKKLAKLGDFYVNDAFAVCHRENASVTQLPKLLPAYAGLLLEKEMEVLSKTMEKPEKPLVLILGGIKMNDKLPVIKNLLPKSEKVLLGSSINSQYFTLLTHNKKVIKPEDYVGENDMAFDIGPKTIEKYANEIQKAKTIIWNGPLGKFEDKKYSAGSVSIAKAVAESKAFSIVGGGETTQLILELGLRDKIGFLSTGGGAMLEFLSGKTLPGIKALE